MFGKKFSSNIRRRKRMMISTIILLVVFLGIGYAAFTTDLSIGGTLNVKKYDHTLYGVLEKAATKGIYAKEYTGEHQDSMAGVGTEKIYHWYAPYGSNVLATEITDKNNVIFANHCWQMIRTTDTGGVKMIYNGEVENNQCLNTRGNHVGYNSVTTTSLSTTYYYGTSYTYDSSNNVFSLNGTITTGTIQTGQYTCRSTSSTGTCTTLYLVDALSSGTTYYVLPLNNSSHYSQFGELQFNQKNNSPAYAGYMYNTIYPVKSKFHICHISGSTTSTLGITYYSDTIEYNTINPNQYTLINPIQASTLNDYTELKGKYIIISQSTHAAEAGYVTNVNGDTVYFKNLSGGDLITSLTVGDSYIENNGVYTLINPTFITYTDWYNNIDNFSIYKGKYVCDGNNNSCSNLKHLYTGSDPSKYEYYYLESNDTYSYAEDVSYNNGIYTLTGDIKTFWDLYDSSNQAYLSTHHYTCLEDGTSCTNLGYMTRLIKEKFYYVYFSNAENINAALNNMLMADDVNQVNSTIKTGVDEWYTQHILGYTSYLEDIIFCADRSITSLGGWNPISGGLTSSLELRTTGSLTCTNPTDKFSISNSKAKLIYPVGLIIPYELELSYHQIIRASGKQYWAISHRSFGSSCSGYVVGETGGVGMLNVTGSYGVRPVISLKPGTEYASGTGSMADPYVVDVPMGTLTINYRSETGITLHEPYVETMPVGASYSIPSPTIPGYITPQTLVTGTMGKYGRTATVTYVEDSDVPPGPVGPGTDA